MFVMQNAPAQPLELPGLPFTPLDAGNSIAKFDLALSMAETGDALSGLLEYNTDIFLPESFPKPPATWSGITKPCSPPW